MAPRANCSPSWSEAAPRSPARTRAAASRSFYDFLLSESRQAELTELLAKVSALDTIEADQRIRGIHHDWSEAADRAQRTVRQISEQLRRFLDDQVWLENRRVLDLVRSVESVALELRDNPPTFGLEVDQPGIEIALPFERPLYQPPAAVAVESQIAAATEEVDADAPLQLRPSSTRRAWSRSSAPFCPRAPRLCCPTSSRCTPSSRARRRSSATSRSTTKT